MKRTKEEKEAILARIGWTVYILECADKTFFAGMVRSFLFRKEINEIGIKGGVYFNNHPERLPVKIVFEEVGLPFREALAKFDYLKIMNRRQRLNLIRKQAWYIGGPWKEYLENKGVIKKWITKT